MPAKLRMLRRGSAELRYFSIHVCTFIQPTSLRILEKLIIFMTHSRSSKLLCTRQVRNTEVNEY